MTKQILVLQHFEKAPAGLIGDELNRLGAKLVTRNLLEGDSIDEAHLASQGLIILGGPMSAFDPEHDEELQQSMALIHRFHESKKPILGICLGAQLLARAFGQPYRSNNGWETGFTPLSLTEAGRADPLLAELDVLPRLFEFHEDSMYLPEQAELLITGDACANQGFRLGSCTYGFQFHPEVSADIAKAWAVALMEVGADVEPALLDSLVNPDLQALAAQEQFTRLVVKRWFDLVSRQSAGAAPNTAVA